MSTGQVQKNFNPTSFFDRGGEYLDAADYLHKVLRLVVLEPIDAWFGGSLGKTDLRGVLKQIEAAQTDGYLQVEWFAPKSGDTARSLLLISGGAVKSAVLRITSVGRDLTGMAAIKRVLENTLPEKAVVGSFFFQSSEKMSLLDAMPETHLNLRSDDISLLINEVSREIVGENQR